MDKNTTFAGVCQGTTGKVANFRTRSSAQAKKFYYLHAGIYSLYQSHPDDSRSWYGSAIATYGKLDLSNQIPGESAGLGLAQKNGGNLLADVSKTFGDEQGYRFSLLLTNAW